MFLISFRTSPKLGLVLTLCEIDPGPNFMALLTLNKESALTEAENSVFTASVFHG